MSWILVVFCLFFYILKILVVSVYTIALLLSVSVLCHIELAHFIQVPVKALSLFVGRYGVGRVRCWALHFPLCQLINVIGLKPCGHVSSPPVCGCTYVCLCIRMVVSYLTNRFAFFCFILFECLCGVFCDNILQVLLEFWPRQTFSFLHTHWK